MMRRLQADEYAGVRSVFRELTEFSLSLDAVLDGTAPGKVWVDDAGDPSVGYMVTPEGHYLAGDVEREGCYASLKEIIPYRAYLICHPESWEGKLSEVWKNRVARRHPREHLRFRRQRIPDWRDLVPEGFRLAPVDRDLLERGSLKNHGEVVEWVDTWHSTEYFLRHGFGFCVLYGDTIASWCVADCVTGHRCEMGIVTDGGYRRRGLATIAVAAAVDHCLASGLTQIGWHCLRSNAGSIAVAEKVGFVRKKAYLAFSSGLPAESATDLTPAEFRGWAEHYEGAVEQNIIYAFHAAEARALAGDTGRAFANLQRLVDRGWKGKREWFEDNWTFARMCDEPEFRAVVAKLTA